MKIRALFAAMAAIFLATFFTEGKGSACPHGPPVVSTQWLAHNLNRPNMVLVDIRTSTEYAVGHVPNAVNIPFVMPVSEWNALSNGLLMEVPAQAELFVTLGSAGITRNSFVVVVNNTFAEGVPASYPRAQTARVATTLLYAGVKDVAILDGGQTKWALENRAISSDIVSPVPVQFNGSVDADLFVSKQYVEQHMGSASTVLLDARDAEVYSGAVIEPYAPVAGHIPGAKSLPAPPIWNDDGTFKNPFELATMAFNTLGDARGKEIIVYCGVGGYAAGWWFVLTEMLGYRNVKFYDGSAQEWVMDPAGPMEM